MDINKARNACDPEFRAPRFWPRKWLDPARGRALAQDETGGSAAENHATNHTFTSAVTTLKGSRRFSILHHLDCVVVFSTSKNTHKVHNLPGVNLR